MPACKSRRTVKSRIANQRGGTMVLRSGTMTQTKGVRGKRANGSKQSKLLRQLPFLSACIKTNGKQRKHMITHANRRQMEAIGEMALNLLKTTS